MENILTEFAEIFEVDVINEDQVLSEFECWDSLTILSVIALASEKYNVTLSAKEVTDSNTIQGLLELIKSKTT